MKKFNLAYFFVLLLMFFIQSGYSQTLTIINQDYEQAKLESNRQNKLLLIDFYTVWCGPCKVIEKKIFENPSVSSEMAKSFIVLRYDAEKDETHRLSLKHHIASYPATIVLNPDQFVLHKLYGFGGAEKELVKNYQNFLNEAMDKNSKNDYLKGISNTTKDFVYPKFYEDYVYRKNTTLDENALKSYWETNKDFLSEISFAILAYFNGTDAVDSFFLENEQQYESLYGKTDVSFVKGKMVFMKFANALDKKDRKLFDSAVEFHKKLYGESENKSLNSWKQNMLMAENRWNEAFKLHIARKKLENLDDDATNDFCWKIFQKCSDKNILKKSVSLMKAITDKDPKYNYLDTYARLLYKYGNKKLSQTMMKKAIKLGKLNKEDTKDNENWLEKNR